MYCEVIEAKEGDFAFLILKYNRKVRKEKKHRLKVQPLK
jgi:hypothetical protein